MLEFNETYYNSNERLTGEILPVIIEDITNYMIYYTFPNGFGAYSISILINHIASGLGATLVSYDEDNIFHQQIVVLKFPCPEEYCQKEILEYAEDINLNPTLSFYDKDYNLYFIYILSEEINDKALAKSIIGKLCNSFEKYIPDKAYSLSVEKLSLPFAKGLNVINNLVVSSNTFIPIVGGNVYDE